jgi:hypothetical protein
VFAPIAAIRHQRELTSAKWMVGMGDPEGLAVTGQIGCM